MITNIVTVNASEKETASKSHSIALGSSPFTDGKLFAVTGYNFVKLEQNGTVSKDAPMCPVLTTNIGNLFVSTIVRSKVDANGNVLEPNGTFNKGVKEIIAGNPNKTNGEILQAIIDKYAYKNWIKVTRQKYTAKSKDGREYAAFLVVLNVDRELTADEIAGLKTANGTANV